MLETGAKCVAWTSRLVSDQRGLGKKGHEEKWWLVAVADRANKRRSTQKSVRAHTQRLKVEKEPSTSEKTLLRFFCRITRRKPVVSSFCLASQVASHQSPLQCLALLLLVIFGWFTCSLSPCPNRGLRSDHAAQLFFYLSIRPLPTHSSSLLSPFCPRPIAHRFNLFPLSTQSPLYSITHSALAKAHQQPYS